MIFSDDWHIHTEHSCDGACMKMSDLVRDASDKGIMRFGVTDHIHTQFNYPDIYESRKSFNEISKEDFFFGVEVSCVSQWELNMISTGTEFSNLTYGIREGGPAGGELAIAIDGEFIEKNGIEYVVAGTHWPMYAEPESKVLIKDYHRQNMFLSRQSEIDIIAHPWWCLGPCENSWVNDFSLVPLSMHREFAASCMENDKLVEVNLAAMILTERYSDRFKEQYIDYLILLRETGVKFAIGSDCHNEFYDIDFNLASAILKKAGFGNSHFYSPV